MNRVLTEFMQTPWAILPDRLATMSYVLHRWAAGIKLTPDQIQAAVGDAPEAAAKRRAATEQRSGSIAVVPVYGIITHRAKDAQNISGPGMTSTESLTRAIRELAADPDISSIVLDIDSPGGSVFGVQELADEIMQARSSKKVVGVANSMAASAAYWIGSAADELYVAPGGMAGSIGVYTAHTDYSKMLEEDGVKVTLIQAGEFKTEGNPYEPLTDEAKAAIQQEIDTYYNQFIGAVAKQRGTTAANVRENYGKGRVLLADEAVKAGMADGVATLDQIISKMQTPQGRRRMRSAAYYSNKIKLESMN